MSFLDYDLNDCIAPKVADPAEYNIRIIKVDEKDADRNGVPYMMVNFEIIGAEPGVKSFSRFYRTPCSQLDDNKLNSAKYQLKVLLEAFGIDFSTPPAEWVGAEGWALLGVETSDQYGDSNKIIKYVSN